MLAPRARLAAWTASLALSFAPALASAEMPTGSFEFQLGGVNSLWMGGDTDTHADADGFCASFGRLFDVVERCDYELEVDGRGKIHGHAEFVGWLGDNLIELEGPIQGAQRGSNRTGVTRASFVIQLAGSVSQGGVTLDMRVSQKLVGQIDAGGAMTGTWTRKTCIEGSACETIRFPAVPSVWSNGHWTLELDVELITFGGGEFGRRSFTAGGLAGVARIRFGDETFCDFAVSGQHDFKKEVADLTLTPTSAKCEGGSLRLRNLAKLNGAAGETFRAQLQYKLFGVAGTTVVDTLAAALYRILLAHYDDPINQPLPPLNQPGSVGGGVMATITVIQLPSENPPQFTSSSTANSASLSVSAMGVLADSADFETLQSGARFELTGFEARPVGPERPVLGTSAELPGVHPLTQY